MVVNSCVATNILEDVDGGYRKKGGRPATDFRSKESLLYKSRNNNVEARDPSSYGNHTQEERGHHLRSQSRSFGRSRTPVFERERPKTPTTNDRPRTPTNDRLRSAEGKDKMRSSTPLAKMTPTERLRSFDRKKTPTKSRPVTPSRGRCSEKQGSATPSKNRSRSKSKDKRPITPKRGRSYDVKKSSLGGSVEKSYTFGDRVKLAMAREDMGAPVIDTTSRYSGARVERPIFESTRLKAPFADHEPETNMFHAKANPTLFGHTKKEQKAMKEQKAKHDSRRMQQDEWHETEHTRHEGKNGARGAQDPVENFRDAYKEVDAEEPITTVTTRSISEMVSDLTISSASNFSTIKSPNRKGVTPKNQKHTFFSPQDVTTQQGFKSTLKSLEVEFNDSFDDTTPQARSTGYTGPHSPLSTGDDGDRYTMISDNNDAFDEAAWNRLKTKTPIVPESENRLKTRTPHVKESGIRSVLKKIDIQPSPKERDGISTMGNGFDLLGKRRSTPRHLLVPKRKPTTPGLAIGESRSFVDQVEKKLNAIKEKREVQEFEEQYFGKKKASKSEPKQGKTEKRVYDETGVADYGIAHATKSAAAKVKKEKKSAVKKIQKAGNALFGVLAGGRDNDVLASQTMLASPRNIASGVMMDMLQCHDNVNSANGGPLAPSVRTGLGKNDTFKLSPHHPSKPERGWFGRKKNENHMNAPSGKGIFEVYNRDSVSSGSKSTGTSSWSGKVLGLRRRGAHGSVGEISRPDPRAGSSAGTKDSSVSSHRIMKHMTTFDSAIEKEDMNTPRAEFAVVELGDDEGVIRTHAILVNRDDVEQQLMFADPYASNENMSAVANSPYGLAPINELSTSKNISYAREKKEAKDDASIDNLELTISFAEQLQQLKQLQKPPHKVPRGAYML